MERFFDLLESFVSRPVGKAGFVLFLLMVAAHSPPVQGMLSPMPKPWAVVLAALVGAVATGGTFYRARQVEEARAHAGRQEKLSRLALEAAYDVKIVPDSSPVEAPFRVYELSAKPLSAAGYEMNRPVRGGVWVECTIQNVGDERLENITLVYRVQGTDGTGPFQDWEVDIRGLSRMDKYTFFIKNRDTTRLRVEFPVWATARIYNETEHVPVQIRRASRSLGNPYVDIRGD